MLGGITSSTTNVVPLPLRGEGLNTRESGEDFMCRAFGAIADLIHRKRSPFPYEGKALGRSAWGAYFPFPSAFFPIDY